MFKVLVMVNLDLGCFLKQAEVRSLAQIAAVMLFCGADYEAQQ